MLPLFACGRTLGEPQNTQIVAVCSAGIRVSPPQLSQWIACCSVPQSCNSSTSISSNGCSCGNAIRCSIGCSTPQYWHLRPWFAVSNCMGPPHPEQGKLALAAAAWELVIIDG